MGYTFNSLSRILDQASIFREKNILTLGTLYPYVGKHEAKILAKRGLRVDVPKERFSEHMFVEVLGAASCHSLDVSDYQQSEIICNLNHPLPDRYIGQYDIVFDGGTLEHLSNLSAALTNIFGLLRKGGIYYFGVPCNNWVNHGFFQFSPTFFSDLCVDNPNLKLLGLHVNTTQKYYDLASQNPAFMQALFSSRLRLNVGGIIQKSGDQINLDLTQSKYREQYVPRKSGSSASASGPRVMPSPLASALRRFASATIQRFSASAWIPLGFKELTLNRLYGLTHKTRMKNPVEKGPP
jgi:SAM-dependent methyltransferase